MDTPDDPIEKRLPTILRDRIARYEFSEKEIMFMEEYTVDFDVEAACLRAGYHVKTAHHLVINKTPKMLYAIDKIRKHYDVDNLSIISRRSAEKKLLDTQDLLSDMLKTGEAKVAGPLVKAHELELRVAGAFKEDNAQRGPQVIINIDMGNDKDKVIDGTISTQNPQLSTIIDVPTVPQGQ